MRTVTVAAAVAVAMRIVVAAVVLAMVVEVAAVVVVGRGMS